MKSIKKLLLSSVSNAALFMAANSIVQCCSGKIYQQNVNEELKNKTSNLAAKKWHSRRHESDKSL